jgi:hypothetical protein
MAYSVNDRGDRLTTMEVVMHRFVLAEFNTHRAFSRNSASSRAIPLAKQMNRVKTDPAIPVVWPAEQKGMQGGAEIDDVKTAEALWLEARDSALFYAEALGHWGVHKSVANRLLEPFMWHTVVVSSTHWGNFFTQRCSPLAQPEIRECAEGMEEAYRKSSPKPLAAGEWHMPYLDDEDYAACVAAKIAPQEVSAARCARVSYLTQDGKRDVNEDYELFQRLRSASPPHMSPAEHVATPSDPATVDLGNFTGWAQLRHMIWGVTL